MYTYVITVITVYILVWIILRCFRIEKANMISITAAVLVAMVVCSVTDVRIIKKSPLGYDVELVGFVADDVVDKEYIVIDEGDTTVKYEYLAGVSPYRENDTTPASHLKLLIRKDESTSAFYYTNATSNSLYAVHENESVHHIEKRAVVPDDKARYTMGWRTPLVQEKTVILLRQETYDLLAEAVSDDFTLTEATDEYVRAVIEHVEKR